jgi:hypothetical protein
MANMKLLREPLFHFLLIGAAIFLLFGLMGQKETEKQERTVVVTAGEINWLTDTWEKRWNRPPTDQEREGVVKQHLREVILFREAVAMGLDKNDIVVRRRLAQKLEFLAKDLIRPVPPTPEELQAYYETHLDKYQPPDLITMSQVFLDPDKRGDSTLGDAKKIRKKLEGIKQPPSDAASFGDPFVLQSYYPLRSKAQLAKLFGHGFAEPVFELEPNQWHGPVLSGYGVHLVYIHNRKNPEPPAFAEVEENVRQDWEDQRREELNTQYINNLMDRYDITIEDEAPVKQSGSI